MLFFHGFEGDFTAISAALGCRGEQDLEIAAFALNPAMDGWCSPLIRAYDASHFVWRADAEALGHLGPEKTQIFFQVLEGADESSCDYSEGIKAISYHLNIIDSIIYLDEEIVILFLHFSQIIN